MSLADNSDDYPGEIVLDLERLKYTVGDVQQDLGEIKQDVKEMKSENRSIFEKLADTQKILSERVITLEADMEHMKDAAKLQKTLLIMAAGGSISTLLGLLIKAIMQ